MNKAMTKAEHYDWVKPGDVGKQVRLEINSLKIDHSYQRGEVSEVNTLALARGFDWVAFNSIVVMQRENGDMYVVDGQQRLLAARKRGDINDVPCLLFKSEGRDHEAMAFISLNIRRAKVRAADKFKAAVLAKLSPEKDIAEWLSNLGMYVTVDGTAKNGICFPAHLVKTWNLDIEATKRAIMFQRSVNEEQPLQSACHVGIYWLCHAGVDVEKYADKFRRLGGLSAMLRAIKTLEIETGQHWNDRLAGLALLRLINHKVKNKVSVPDAFVDA